MNHTVTHTTSPLRRLLRRSRALLTAAALSLDRGLLRTGTAR